MELLQILQNFRKTSYSEREKGDKFEKFIKKYFQIDPVYSNIVENVWLWSEWPGRNGQPDTGIDMVAKEKITGTYWAIQCKFYGEHYKVSKADIDTFMAASGKSFVMDGTTQHFTQRIVVSTTDNWGSNAEETIANQMIPVSKIGLLDIANSQIDWNSFSFDNPESIRVIKPHDLRPHQRQAIDQIIKGYESVDRGKMIMACGGGKTFTSLKLAQEYTNNNGLVLFLVPSISLLSQSYKEWNEQAGCDLLTIAVCSDSKANRTNEDISVNDLYFPASTDVEKVAKQMNRIVTNKGLKVIFSTYQSIKIIEEASSKTGLVFDLIIADEAHRTTGVTLSGEDETHFTRVHDNNRLPANKRLYMTATPRVYNTQTKDKAEEASAILCSMDDELMYGPELYYLGFSEAVDRGLLSDYKVLILAVDEKYVSREFQALFADENSELNFDDMVKVTGCWNGLSKKSIVPPDSDQYEFAIDPTPMKRAVAFTNRIEDSKRVAELFTSLQENWNENNDGLVSIEIEHVDGQMRSEVRNKKLSWLKEETEDATCRILTNARCLSEGIDVPALDAVIFLNPRSSIVDIIQSVGRVMRKTEEKKYGYIILPIGIPSDKTPEVALNDNKKYKIVWDVLQALRAHDDRFENTINKIDLNQNKPGNIQVIGVTGKGTGDDDDNDKNNNGNGIQLGMNLSSLQQWKDAVYARIVQKCGTKEYWENWAKDVADIATRTTERISYLINSSETEINDAFGIFLSELQMNLNTSITENDAISMLAQHLITKPVFDALFEGYRFIEENPVSQAMEKIISILSVYGFSNEMGNMEKLYHSVHSRAAGIDNLAGRQQIILELYDKFFKTALPKESQRLGIVYTPAEVVDFIIHSVDFLLKENFNVGIGSKGVQVIDPFTGTGTFISRLIASGLISDENLDYKYTHEMHANEIVLLAYYIAALNIEESFRYTSKSTQYKEFPGIVFADTFQMSEKTISEIGLPENSERIKHQKNLPIQVIIANPPYSIGQKSQNDNNQNQSYEYLDESITATYAKDSNAGLIKGLYDAYIRAFRWASNRILDNGNNKGIIGFVTNGAYIDNAGMDGFRKHLIDEFTEVYVLNLRGNARTSGELRRKEAGNVFGSGSRTPIAITILVKNPTKKASGKLHYYDIGDYLSRTDKLNILKDKIDISSISFEEIAPDQNNDWLNKRNDEFESYIPLADDNKKSNAIFGSERSHGIVTGRDSWIYGFSKEKLSNNMNKFITNYNKEVDKLSKLSLDNPKQLTVKEVVDKDGNKIKWTDSLFKKASQGKKISFSESNIITSLYRPFCKQYLYYEKDLIERAGKQTSYFASSDLDNRVIIVSGTGGKKGFSSLITNLLPDFQVLQNGQTFPYNIYSEIEAMQISYFGNQTNYMKKDAISDKELKKYHMTYHDQSITKEDIFYFVYGFLHSPQYRDKFEFDLGKGVPRIPFVKEFHAFSKAGRLLADLHINYESVDPYPLEITGTHNYEFDKLRFGKINNEVDKTTILYNNSLKIHGIPLGAYDYVVNGKSPIEWLMDKYKVTTDKESKIINNPNDWLNEQNDQMYVVKLIQRLVTVSLETLNIIDSLPDWTTI